MSAQDERAVFDRLVASHLDELLRAARRELRYRIALGELGRDDLSPEELVGETLARAWKDRHRRPALLGTRAWLHALLHRVAESIARREMRFRRRDFDARVGVAPGQRHVRLKLHVSHHLALVVAQVARFRVGTRELHRSDPGAEKVRAETDHQLCFFESILRNRRDTMRP